jgi:SSS family solute:Na+ symporter
MLGMVADSFGGVIGLILLWYGALVGPIAVPMILGLLPAFRSCGPAAAMSSVFAGAVGFMLVKFIFADALVGASQATALTVAVPISAAIIAYIGVGLAMRSRDARSDELLAQLSADAPSPLPSSSAN